ncbi:MAG: thioredoxin family protein [Candidatus Thermoplasmatota archaeon]|nr:thioredoxin family protein [Candidatus Thermoplasmatota archaeon]
MDGKSTDASRSRTIRLVAVLLVGAFFFATGTYFSGYGDSKAIGSVLCLSCIKLEPKISVEFRFETANGAEHPQFVLDALKDGPILIDYSQNNCEGCEIMHPYFNALADKYAASCNFLYINMDETPEMRPSFDVYNVLGGAGGTPMWVMVTLGQDKLSGLAKPYFAVGYGYLGETVPEKGAEMMERMIIEGITLYGQNS